MTKSLRSASLCALIACLTSQAAYADSGRLRFSKTAGPFQVTLFTTPEPLTPGPADFSVMVQDAATGQILSNAEVLLQLDQPGASSIHAQATHALATNKLLQAAEFSLPFAGSWHLHLDITQASAHAAIDTDIAVQPGSRNTLLIWLFALLPCFAVGLFVLHQRQKLSRQSRGLA